jgi:hypothetical protein
LAQFCNRTSDGQRMRGSFLVLRSAYLIRVFKCIKPPSDITYIGTKNENLETQESERTTYNTCTVYLCECDYYSLCFSDEYDDAE